VIEVLRAADIGSTFNGGHVEEEKVYGRRFGRAGRLGGCRLRRFL